MKKIFCVAAITAVFAGHASAEELWVPHVVGSDGGLATGALPPPGFYFINTTLYAPLVVMDSKGSQTGIKATVLLEIPSLLWAAPFKVLGAQYAAGIAQPLDDITLKPEGGSYNNINGSNPFATVLIPYVLSWNLPQNYHVATQLNVLIPDGTWKNPTKTPAGNVTGFGFVAFEPSVAVSWLKDGWNLSFKTYVDLNTKDQHMDYTSGNVIGTEGTIAKTFGKWTFGVNTFTQNQFTDDKGSDVAAVNGPQAAKDGHRMQNYGLGPTVGYNFGPVILDMAWDHSIRTVNQVGGNFFYTRIVVPL
ncbi:MAG: transporter [Legionellales bacterium]